MAAHQNINLNLLLHQPKDRKALNNESRRLADDRVVNCIRCLAMDSVQKANSGHPGTPMAMAPAGYALWARVLNYDPTDPTWPNRDRFVLSMGHASMLLYGLLHVAGVRQVHPDGTVDGSELAVPLSAMQEFRQSGSKCPGHPEYHWTSGVETTTGPLGQGVANSVGMAIASKWCAATFNRPDFHLFNFDVYAFAGDGCMQEGVSHEAASLAGHLKLDNLCWLWDNNHITIEGNTAWATSEDVATRFIAYGWNVNRVGDANDVDALERAIMDFKRESQRPTLIIVDSHIAWGAPTKQDTFSAHGTPLGEEEVSATKKIYDWPDEKFFVPEDASSYLRKQMAQRGGVKRKAWDELLEAYKTQHPEPAAALEHMSRGTLPSKWDRCCTEFPPDAKGLATRQSSSMVLNMVAQGVPWLVGGSADLGNSCLTTLTCEGAGDFMPPSSGWGSYSGRIFHFGIREHAMGSIMNGMAVSKLRPFGSTFLVFSDYMKPPIRLSACMEVPCIWIFTHDSFGVGEDGPTHQPIEHLAALRSIPGLLTFRPCDANEVLEMWKFIMQCQHEPIAVVLSRQAVPTLDRSKYAAATLVSRGAYVIAGGDETPDLILMATGSEVSLMLEAHTALAAKGVKVRSVSMPCLELFKRQPDEYINSVLPDACRARVSIEAATKHGWGSFIGLDGEHLGMITFGKSGTLKNLQKEFGFTVEDITTAALRVLRKKPRSMASEADVLRAWKRKKSGSHSELVP